MKSFLHIKAKKIETIISYFDNHLWNVGIQKNLYLFLTEAERGDVLRIHVTETDECYEFSYDEVMDIVFHNRIPERFKKEVGPNN